jgi:hypothetical protein
VGAKNISTIAGNKTADFTGDGGWSYKATLSTSFYSGIAIDRNDNIFICDSANNRIRMIAASGPNSLGLKPFAGHIYTVAGNGTYAFSADGTAAAAASLEGPTAITVDSVGNLYFAESGSKRVRMISAVSGVQYGIGMTAGNLYTLAGNGNVNYSGDGGSALSAGIGNPLALLLGPGGL